MSTEFPAAVRYVVGTRPVADGRARFREIFCRRLAADPDHRGQDCETFLLRLNDEPPPDGQSERPPSIRRSRYRVLVVPGFLNECFAHIALPFGEARGSLDDGRFEIDTLVVSGRSSSDSNADEIAAAVDDLSLDPDEALILIGHSKGVVDILHYLVRYPRSSRRVAAVVSVAGAVNGTPLADQFGDLFRDLSHYFVFGRCDVGDKRALDSLRPQVTMSWLADNPLPERVHYFSLVALSRREHVNLLLQAGYDRLRIYSPRNDGLLLGIDQIIPGGTLLGYANADHWAVVLALENQNLLISRTIRAPREFPRKVLLEAILDYVAEALDSQEQQS
jgi:hypothetical protein